MAADDAPGRIQVQVAYAPAPHRMELSELELPGGSTVRDALRACGLASRHGADVIDTLKVGVWGKVRELDTALRDGDRVELYRPLRVDPKEARRQRYRRDGVKRAPRA